MNIICSPAGVIDIERPGQGLADIARAEFSETLLDISMYCSRYELENVGEMNTRTSRKTLISQNPLELHDVMSTMIEKCKETSLKHTIAYAPYLSRATHHKGLNDLIKNLVVESIKACGKAGCKFIVVRPLFAGLSEADIWKINREYYLYLSRIAKENDVMVLLENQCKDINGHLIRGICSDGRTAAEWVDRLNAESGEELFGFCMDTGVCNLCGQNIYDFVLAVNKRLKVVILRDCDGNNENAMLPFTSVNNGQSQMDWLNLIRGLREIAFDSNLVINMADTANSFSTILRPGLLQLAKSVADFFKWQIELESLLMKYSSRVLFGAGNMCRNYMKCYGEKFPPLFTCDNNRTMWGTEFCGLEVKSPESLKQLPEDCVIFICNIFYREIELQLRDMGIKNPVEFFNDEYMPTFYFDRLEEEGRN